jgi:hypothetical protein
MSMTGLIEEVYRLPLCEMSAPLKQRLAECLKQVGLIR